MTTGLRRTLERLFTRQPPSPPPTWPVRELAVAEAMQQLVTWVRPTAPPALMEQATRLAFASVPGYTASCVGKVYSDDARTTKEGA